MLTIAKFFVTNEILDSRCHWSRKLSSLDSILSKNSIIMHVLFWKKSPFV